MHHSIDFPSIKSKLLLSNKISCACKAFLTGYKRPPPLGFKTLNLSIFFCLFYIISTQTTYFNKKLRTLRRFTKPESAFRFVQFFLYTLYIYIQSSVSSSPMTGSFYTTGEGLAKFSNLVLSCNFLCIKA